jgi:hypothetical protein
MFYYIEVHLLAHYIEGIKMHGETVKNWTELLNVHIVSLKKPFT